jgi:hypothetical protein
MHASGEWFGRLGIDDLDFELTGFERRLAP